MPTSVPVFAYSDPIDFLNDRLRSRQARNPNFSLSEWSRQLGYRTPSMLTQVIKRERRLKMNLATKLAADLKLRGKALRYFECLALQQSGKTEAEKKMYSRLIQQMRPQKFQTAENLTLRQFSEVADWFHWAILEMTHLSDFDSTVSFVRKRLDGDLPVKTIRDAMARLLKAGFLVKDESGRIRRASEDPIFMRNQIPSEAIREFHLQMIERAKIAVKKQTTDERYLRGTTLALKMENLEKAKDIVRKAHLQLLELAEQDAGDEVYQFSTQLFRLTAPKKGPAHD